MGTKKTKKAKAKPGETPAAEVCMHADGHGFCQNSDSNSQGSECCGCEDREVANQSALAVGMIWTDPRDGQKYNVVKANDRVKCAGCHFFEAEADCPESDSEGTPVCESAVGDTVKFEKVGKAAKVEPLKAGDFAQVPKVSKSKAKKAKPAAPAIAGMAHCPRDIPAANLIHAEWNKRGVIEPEDVADLVASIKAMGLIERVVVREGTLGGVYVILAGHMRVEACKLAGLDPIPCDVVECDNKKAHMVTAIENMHRTDLTAMQEGEVVEDLLAVGYTAEEVAEQTGWNLRRVYRRASLRALTPKWRNAAYAYGLNAAFLEEVSRLPTATQDEVLDKLQRRWDGKKTLENGNASVLKDLIADVTMDLAKAPWMKKHPEWCASCERCSNANPDLFDESETGDNAKCLDAACWEQRKAAIVDELKADLRKKHGEIRTASDGQYRCGQIRDAKSRKDKGHSVPLVVTDGENAGTVLWVAGAADKAAARDRGEDVPASKQPTIAEKRAAWVIRKVRDMLGATSGADNPFMTFNDWSILRTMAITGTQFSGSYRKEDEWGQINNQTEQDVKAKLWGRVAPVLQARINYTTITDCEPYYAEAVMQAEWFFNLFQADLDAEAAEAIKDKKASK